MKKEALLFLVLFPTLIMAQPNKEVTTDFLQSFAEAFNAHDIKAIMRLMTNDCIFQASAGPDVDGEKFVGSKDVATAFEDVFKNFPDAKWNNPVHFISGNRGLSEWTFTGTKTDGTKVEVTGCDVFIFKDGRIAVKNSYRKNRMPGR